MFFGVEGQNFGSALRIRHSWDEFRFSHFFSLISTTLVFFSIRFDSSDPTFEKESRVERAHGGENRNWSPAEIFGYFFDYN